MSKLIEKHSPEIICLQETKVDNENFPMESINDLGYEALINGQKGHYGVSTLYKSAPIEFQIGFPSDKEDAQCRLISSKHKFANEEVTVINGYFPQGESRDHPKKFPYKEKFFKDLMIYLNKNFVELNKKLIPVNYLVRKSEKKAQEEKRLFIENRFRVSQGLKPFLNFQDFLDSDPEEFNELSDKIVLEEAARILIDQINLNKPNRLSSSDFR